MGSDSPVAIIAACFMVLELAFSSCPRLDADEADGEVYGRMFSDFVTVDAATRLFRNSQGVFAAPCVTYVQPEPGKFGFNAGTTRLVTFDLTKLRSDFRRMRAAGIRAVYVWAGAGEGFFLNPDGSWRKVADPLTGVIPPETPAGLREKINAVHKKAAEAGIGPFEHNYEIYDYLLDCARAEGLYVVTVIPGMWSQPAKYDIREIREGFLSDRLWRQIIDDWCKILGRLKDRKEILGYLVEGEIFFLTPWNEKQWRLLGPDAPKVEVARSPLEGTDPRLARRFQAFVKGRHRSIEALKKRWGHGYDRSDPRYMEPSGIPLYPFKPGVFDRVGAWDDVPLPTVERPRGSETTIGKGKGFPHWLNVPLDPVWVEFGYYKEALYLKRTNELADSLRKADPNHLFMLSAAADDVPVFHPFYVAWAHGASSFDVLLHGGGYALETFERTPARIPPHKTVLEMYQSVGLYRPFAVRATGGARAFGMGEGGFAAAESTDPASRVIHASEIMQDRFITALLFDNFGGGSALANIWDWGTLTGATLDNPKLHDHVALSSIAEVSRAVEADTFTRGHDARILILANGPTLHSVMKQLSWNNIASLSSVLAMTHCLFDVVTTDEVSFGARPGKVDISRYQAIFMPQLFQIPRQPLSGEGPLGDGSDDADLWVLLRQWLAAEPQRMLCVGLTCLNDAYFNPLPRLPGIVRNVVGNVSPGPLEVADGPHSWQITGGGKLTVVLNNTFIQTITIPEGAASEALQPYLKQELKVLGVRRRLPNGSQVYYFGFPLGLSWSYFMPPELRGGIMNERFDPEEMARFYAKLIGQAGIVGDYEAPPSIVAYISDNARAVLVRQRFSDGPRKGKLLSSELLRGHIYAGASTTIERKGKRLTGSVSCDLGDNRSQVLLSIGTAEPAGQGRVSVRTVASSDATRDERRFKVAVEGNVRCRLSFGDRGGAVVTYAPPAPLKFAVIIRPDGSGHLLPE